MKKIIISVLIALLLGVSTASAFCIVDRVNVAPYVVWEYQDRDCNGTIDIIQEYRLINGVWVATRWWYY